MGLRSLGIATNSVGPGCSSPYHNCIQFTARSRKIVMRFLIRIAMRKCIAMLPATVAIPVAWVFLIRQVPEMWADPGCWIRLHKLMGALRMWLCMSQLHNVVLMAGFCLCKQEAVIT